MPTLQQPAWWVPALLFLIHQLTQAMGWHWWLADGYLDPLLFLPILLGLWLAERRKLFGTQQLSGVETIVAGVVLAVIGEELFPRLQEKFVRDWWDYGAYGLGLAWFWLMINRNNEPAADQA